MTSQRLRHARQWVDEYTPEPHADLGRDGAVCPFMIKTLRLDYLTMVEFDATYGNEALVVLAWELLDRLRERAAEVGSDAIHLVSMVVPFGLPDFELKTMVDRAHAELKPDFVRLGFMAGDFWPDHETVGLHSEDFRPFSSPVPILGMRHIVPADLPFFVKHERCPRELLDHLRTMRGLFEGRLNADWARRLDEAEALAAARVEQNR